MPSLTTLRVLEVVQSLEKGGRTTRFTDTVSGLRARKITVLPLCLSQPVDWVDIDDLQIIERKQGFNFQLILKIRTLIKTHKINLVHAHCELSQLYAGIASFTCNTRVVGTFHRSDLARYQPSLVNQLIGFFVHKYVAVSHDRLTLLTENLNLPQKKCHVVHGGTTIKVSPSAELITLTRHELAIPNNQITLLSVGHLGHIKGHQDTITALFSLKNEALPTNIKLYIAGDGSSAEKQKLEDQIRQLKLENNVTLLGQINNVTQWLIACDIFVQPSIEEAFGLVFIEAGAQAKPVVATRVGGIKEIILHEETGYLVAPESPKELTQALQRLIFSPELRTTLGEQAYLRIQEKFSISTMINNYLTIFTQTVAPI